MENLEASEAADCSAATDATYDSVCSSNASIMSTDSNHAVNFRHWLCALEEIWYLKFNSMYESGRSHAMYFILFTPPALNHRQHALMPRCASKCVHQENHWSSSHQLKPSERSWSTGTRRCCDDRMAYIWFAFPPLFKICTLACSGR
jgi:hypothetical protein